MTRFFYRFISRTKGNSVADKGGVTVLELKRLIVKKEKLSCDLDIFNAATGSSFGHSMSFVPNKSSVIVIRKPFENQSWAKKVYRRYGLTLIQKFNMATHPPPKKVITIDKILFLDKL
jgi:hypothetical protein